MISEEVERLHRQSLIVEGHRDVFERSGSSDQEKTFPY